MRGNAKGPILRGLVFLLKLLMCSVFVGPFYIAVVYSLKSQEETKDIPIIFLTSIYDIPTEIEGLKLGAVDYVTKPFNPELLLKRVEIHLLVANQQRALTIQNELLEKQQLNHTNAELKKALQQMRLRREGM
jgi:response regulator RpfG family c-di-GMP phosphodiesterase